MLNYLNEHELSKITGLAVQTLRNWRHIRQGFPYSKIGRAVRYDLKEIERYMNDRKITFENQV
jgi:hypothetical protein